MALHREDYLLRQTRAIGAMIARMVGLRTAGQHEDARQELDAAYGELLGPRADVLRRVDVTTTVMLLDNADALLALARLTQEDAAQAGDGEIAATLRTRALHLALEAARLTNPDAAIREIVADLAREVDPDRLTSVQRTALREVLDQTAE